MRVLWVCNIMLPVIAEALHREASNKEGWLSGLLSQIVDREDTGMTLAVAFPVPADAEAPWRLRVPVRTPARRMNTISHVMDSARTQYTPIVTSRSWKKNCVRSRKIMIRM